MINEDEPDEDLHNEGWPRMSLIKTSITKDGSFR
jgi:hypothetical protein